MREYCSSQRQSNGIPSYARKCLVIPVVLVISFMSYTDSLSITPLLSSRLLQKHQHQQRRMISASELSLSTENNDVNGAASTPLSNAPRPTGSDANDRQGMYGTTLDMPSTYVRCGKCQTAYAISEEDLGARGGRRLECTVCTHCTFEIVLNLRQK